MRSALGLGILILVGVFLYDKSVRSSLGRTRAEGDVSGLRLFSTGYGLAPPLELRSLGLAAIWSGQLLLNDATDRDGLLVAGLTPRGDLLDFEIFDLAGSPGAASALSTHCAAQSPGTVLAMVVRGTVRPRGGDARARDTLLETLVQELGVVAPPFQQDASSWAFATRRTVDGWERLGEAYSCSRGVVLALPLGLERLDSMVERPAQVFEPSLEVEPLLVSCIPSDARVRVQRRVELSNGTLDAIRFAPGAASQSWPAVEVGPNARFEAWLSLGFVAFGKSDGLTMELWINGVKRGERELLAPAGAGPGWERWGIDLQAAVGQMVELELRIDPHGSVDMDVVLCGAPLVLWESPR